MQTAAGLDVVRSALKEAIARSPVTAREISRRLGRHWGYLTRVLGGGLAIKFRETAQALTILGVAPQDFFEALFPLGGRRPPPPEPASESARRWRETYRRLERELAEGRGVEPLAPAALTAKAGRVLRSMIRRRGSTQRELSRRIGRSPDALGLALRGTSQLTLWHVFATLEALRIDPGRFFAELFGPDDRDVTASFRWLQQLDDVEAAYAGGG